MMENEDLKRLYEEVDKCWLCEKDGNNLRHILGFGKEQPDVMLILVNPTYRNLSAHREYYGPRFPFIGVRQFWRVLAEAGLISRGVAHNLPTSSYWRDQDTWAIQSELMQNSLFVTNIVKCCYSHSKYPIQSVIDMHLEYLSREIQIVKPKQIVAFGGIVFKVLTGYSIVLSEYWKDSSKRDPYKEKVSGLGIPVIPCYFPVGRGSPKKAALILRMLFNSRNTDKSMLADSPIQNHF